MHTRAMMFVATLTLAACSASNNGSGSDDIPSSGGHGDRSGSGGSGGSVLVGGGPNVGGGGGTKGGDPKTCAEAAASRTYIGCEFWPVPVANQVWHEFDFAAVVANAGNAVAHVDIDRGSQPIAGADVPPNSLHKFYLPWVEELKGPTFDVCTNAPSLDSTVRAASAAYHLVSSVPVTVYQFNALEYRSSGGPPGKDWSSCLGEQYCDQFGGPMGCYSYSNDASLLLPTPALTGNYRITAQTGDSSWGMRPYFAVTGTEDGTNVTLKVSNGGAIAAGGGLSDLAAGQVAQFSLARGEVLQLLGTPSTDLAGSLVQADKPVQVIAGVPCINNPHDKEACDHIEESIPPAETWGKHYIVTSPTSALGNVIGHEVRLYGNVDGTKLTYPNGAPPNAPASIDSGAVVDLGITTTDFEVVGDHEFAVGSFMLGGSLQDPNAVEGYQKGDPSMSLITPVEQYRTKYVFLAPDDYETSYADLIIPDGATVTLDGAPLPVSPSPIGNGFNIARVTLGGGVDGAHVLDSDQGVGLQVMGYGAFTSYNYPGGLNLDAIAPPPPPIK